MKKIFIITLFVMTIVLVMLALKKNEAKPLLDFAEKDAIAWHAKWRKKNKLYQVSVEKKKNIWYVVDPVFIKSDQSETLANIKNFLSLKVLETLGTISEWEEKYDKKNSFTNANIFSITYQQKDKQKTFSIKVGEKHNVLHAYFVEFGGKVHLVEEWYALALRKSLDDLIEKEILKILPRQIKKLQTKDFSIVKQGLYYRLTNFAQKTNTHKTDRLIQDLAFLQAKRAVTEPLEKKQFLKKAEKVNHFFIETVNKKKINITIYFLKKENRAFAKIKNINLEKTQRFYDLYEIYLDKLANLSVNKKDLLLP